jgi:hypothetical protein
MTQPAPAFTCVLTFISDASLREILAVWIHVRTTAGLNSSFHFHNLHPFSEAIGQMHRSCRSTQPFGSMPQPLPALTWLLTFMLCASLSSEHSVIIRAALAQWVYAPALARLDSCFDSHDRSPYAAVRWERGHSQNTLTVWIHRSAAACFNFGSDFHVCASLFTARC